MALDNLKVEKIDIGVVATLIAATNYKRKDLAIYNNGSETIYIDNVALDCTLNSFPVPAGCSLSFTDYQGSLYGIVALATEEVRVVYTQY